MNNTVTSINKEKLLSILKTDYIGRDFHYFDIITSTFDKASDINVVNGSVICAGAQTNGRGRLGRTWESQKGGIYFSVILHQPDNDENLSIMTNRCALAVCTALEKYVCTKIKWPNDIITGYGKKLCGILTRIQTHGEKSQYINVGIGINANNDIFDKNLKYATSLKKETGMNFDENKILCEVLSALEKCLNLTNNEVIKQYTEKCITINNRVRIIFADGSEGYTGKCVRINNDGTLTIKKDDGSLTEVNSGEVSVRGVYGENYV